jgi:oligopeptide/dipeptide ABC transporter ATP-binding protein
MAGKTGSMRKDVQPANDSGLRPAPSNGNGSIIKVENLQKRFPVSAGMFRKPLHFVHAVDGINFEIPAGGSLGLVGESGCGKTTTGKLIVKLFEPSEGHIYLRDPGNGGYTDVAVLRGRGLKVFRRRVQMIFQDPYESLNPRRTVAIARALVVGPQFVVADEPTSMLDVSIRIGVMELMADLAQRMGVSYLYITHDLAVARYMCERIAVMYTGKIVELADSEELLANPLHPYSRALISAVPVPDPRLSRDVIEIKGGIAKPIDPPPRCRFFPRCPLADQECEDSDHPPLEDKGSNHFVACYKVS